MKRPVWLLAAFVLALPLRVRGQQLREIAFESGGVTLRGYLSPAVSVPSRALVVYVHGNPGGPANEPSALADPLTARGFDVFRFNYRGVWGNGDVFTLTNSIADLRAALDALTEPATQRRLGIDASRIFLYGVSFGTAVALVGAPGDARVEGIVSLLPCDHGYFGGEFADPDSPIRRQLEPLVDEIFGEDGAIHQDGAIFTEDLIAHRAAYAFPTQRNALMAQRLLFLGGVEDDLCPVESHLFPLYRALRRAGHPHLDARIWNTTHDLDGMDRDTLLDAVSEWVGVRP